MKIIRPHIKEVVFHTPEGTTTEQWLERVGRICYKSEDKITDTSAPRFIHMIWNRGHHAILEHTVASAVIVADRGLTHELVRHRMASFAQESTRYCNYSKGKFGSEIMVVVPESLTPDQQALWELAMANAETHYMQALSLGMKPEIARGILPINLKAEIVITANLREWMHIFNLRCDTAAHPVIRGIMRDIRQIFWERIPSVFE